MVGYEELLDGRVAEGNACPADHEGYKAPWEEMRRNEEQTGCDEEKEEDGRRQRLVREIRRRREGLKNQIVNSGEIIHAILQVPHIPEKVFRHLASRFDGAWWGKWGPVHRVCCAADCCRRWRMSCEVGGYHDEEESCSYREDGDEVGFDADEGADCEEGDGLRGFSPGEETLEAVLKDEYYSDSATEVSTCSLPAGRSACLALKRRKLFVINGSEKLGRLIYFELLTSGAISN